MRRQSGRAVDDSPLVHQAMLFESTEEQAHELAPLMWGALRDGQRVTAVLDTPVVDALRHRIGDDVDRIDVHSPSGEYGYPVQTAREVERLARESTGGGRRALLVGEPCFEHPGMDQGLWMQVESAYNSILADAPVTLLCAYNAQQRSDSMLAAVRCTHHQVREHGSLRRSADYVDLPDFLAEHPAPAPPGPPPEDALTVEVARDVPAVRRHVGAWARHEGLHGDRADDLTVAVNEIVTNAVVHGSGRGSVLLWRRAQALAVEVSNVGELEDEHLGLVRPTGLRSNGRGLWMTRQLCDTVYAWPEAGGTHVRVEMALNRAG